MLNVRVAADEPPIFTVKPSSAKKLLVPNTVTDPASIVRPPKPPVIAAEFPIVKSPVPCLTIVPTPAPVITPPRIRP